jgi:hypothetical protein
MFNLLICNIIFVVSVLVTIGPVDRYGPGPLGMVPAPLAYPFDMARIAEVVFVLGFFKPALLACAFAGFAAGRFGAKLLMPGVARVRDEKTMAMRALAFCVDYHRPQASLGSRIAPIRLTLNKTEC